MIHTTWSTTTSFSNNFNFQLHYLECEYSFFNGFRTASINNFINIITLPLDIIHVIITKVPVFILYEIPQILANSPAIIYYGLQNTLMALDDFLTPIHEQYVE